MNTWNEIVVVDDASSDRSAAGRLSSPSTWACTRATSTARTSADRATSCTSSTPSSLTAFGQKLGLRPAKLCDIEKGRRTVSPARAAAWALTLGYSERQFVRLAVQQQLDDEGLGHLHVQIASA